MTEQQAPEVARRQLRLFLRMSEQAGMEVDEQARSLGLEPTDWGRWLNVVWDAPLPESPALPMMLRRLGYVCHRLERRTALRGLRQAA
jgi:hypothetical protein